MFPRVKTLDLDVDQRLHWTMTYTQNGAWYHLDIGYRRKVRIKVTCVQLQDHGSVMTMAIVQFGEVVG